ncbi:MAG: diguanylate cyclase [Candidatus Acidiferrales bacterium]
MTKKSLILRHVVLSVGFVVVYLLLNRPEVILVSQLGFTAWYPATGLVFALMLGVSPWYLFLACFADALAGHLIYHQPLNSWSETVAPLAGISFYAAAAILLRGPLRIDVGLRRRRDVMRYVFLTLLAAIGSTAVGVLSVTADHTVRWDQFWSSAFAWYVGDAIGLLGFAPFLLIHVLPWVRKQFSSDRSEALKATQQTALPNQRPRFGFLLEAIAQAGSILLVLWILFGPTLGSLHLFYLSFVPILWVAMRHGVKRVVTAILVLDFGIVAALHFFNDAPNALPKVGLLMLVVSATGLFVGSAVSERHRMAKELHERTLYLNSLIENSPVGIVVLDRGSRVELCNDAFEDLFLYKRDELMGKKLAPLISQPAEVDEAVELMSRIGSGQQIRRAERKMRKDGSLIDVELNAVPLMIDGHVRGAYAIYNNISVQIQAAEEAKQHAELLNHWVEELQLRTTQMTLLNQMSDLLQCCASLDEAHAVVGQSSQKLFPSASSGTLFVFRSSRNVLEAMTAWGASHRSDLTFEPEACWALRRGQPQWNVFPAVGVSCAHLKGAPPGRYLCVPMVAQGDTLGILHLQFAGDPASRPDWSENLQTSLQNLASTVAGQVGLSLASLQLRETLREQSIRDPLTGLYNRRFMQESLDRELQRAKRKKRPLAVAFLDLDHFKKFNDAFGHDAGDLVLRSLADIFRQHFRADDVICRYGGEEFAVILPESSAKDAGIRANDLRAAVKKLRLRHQGKVLDRVTVSIGVSAYPEDGSTPEDLLKVADENLYEAKSQGRDRVAVGDL